MRRRSWSSSPGSPAFLHASAHVRLNDLTGRPPVEHEWDDARLGALTAPCVLVAPLQERAERRRERKRAPLAVLRHAGLQSHETSAPVELTPVSEKTSLRRHPVRNAKRMPSATSSFFIQERREATVVQVTGGGANF